MAGTLQDVTEEAEARSARDLLSYVVQSTGDAIVTKSADGTITSWNRGAEQLYGYTAEEAIGRPSGFTETPDRARRVAEAPPDRVLGPVGRQLRDRASAQGRQHDLGLADRLTGDRRQRADRVGRDHRARHDGAGALRGAPAPHGRPRPADRPVQPPPLRRGAQARAGPGRPLRRAQRGTEHRHRQLQGDQRLGRPRRRRRGAQPRGARARPSTPAPATWWRASGGDEFAVLLSAVGAREARTAAEHLLAEIRSSPAAYGGKPFRITRQHRRRHVRVGRRDRRRGPGQRRPRDVRSQDLGARPSRRVHADRGAQGPRDGQG